MGFMKLFHTKPGLPRYQTDVRPYLDTFEDRPMYVLVDLGLHAIAPHAEFTRYIALILPVTISTGSGQPLSEGELKELHRIEDKCIREAEQKGFLYAGHAIVTAAEYMYIAFYCREKDKDAVVTALTTICRTGGRNPSRVIAKQDREWGYYLDRLYPDIYHMQALYHQEILDDARKHGDSGATPRAVSFWLYFASREDADQCLGEAVSAGFELEKLDEKAGRRAGEKNVAMTLKKQMPLDIARMNAEAVTLIDLAKKYGGDYDGVETEIVKK